MTLTEPMKLILPLVGVNLFGLFLTWIIIRKSKRGVK